MRIFYYLEGGPPVTLADARAFTLRFGRFQGRTLAQAAREDAGYVRWLRDDSTAHDAVRKAATLVLDAIENPRAAYVPGDDEYEPV